MKNEMGGEITKPVVPVRCKMYSYLMDDVDKKTKGHR